MRIRFLVFCAVSFAIVQLPLDAQEVGTWGHDETEAKWTQKSDFDGPDIRYKFYGQTPRLEDFPKILAEATQRPPLKQDSARRGYAWEHLTALSRCQFVDPYRDSNPVPKWEDWWQRYGKQSLVEIQEKGQRYPEAWQRLPGTQAKPCPDYKILVPEVWSAKIKFRSGGQFSLHEEITFEVSREECRLCRRYRKQVFGKQWTREEWRDFTCNEATQFYAMLIYSIDHPWLYKDAPWEVRSQVTFNNEQYLISHFLGRGEEWTTLYSGTDWSGILDENGQVIVNDDPWMWHSQSPRYDYLGVGGDSGTGDNVVDGPWLDCRLGVVYLVVLDCFPDPAWKPDESRWVNVDLPKIYDQMGDAAKKAVFDSIYP